MCVGMNCDGTPLEAVAQAPVSNAIDITFSGFSSVKLCEADADGCGPETPPPAIIVKLGEEWFCLRHAGLVVHEYQ